MTLPAPLAPLANIRQWVTYRLMPNDKGKTDKLPCNWQTGEISSAHEPGNWTTYDQAMSMAMLADRGHGSGAGFVLSPGDNFWFVDIDNCLTAERKWSSLALELCSRLAGAAIEVSQSGKGLHIIGTGAVPHHRCKNIPLGLELYTERRFIAITGTSARGDVSADLSGPMASVVGEYFTPKADSGSGPLEDWTSEPCEGWIGSVDDDALIRRARKATGKASVAAALRPGSAESVTFDDLWTGNVEALARQWPADASSNNPYDASSADMSLAMRLAFWTGRDCERIERLMRMSGIMRDKYERRDYIERTIMLAAGGVTDVCKDKPRDAPPTPVGPPIEVRAPDGTLRTLQANDDKSSLLNVEAHLSLAGRTVAYDEFADQMLLDGQPLNDNDELLARADLAETYFIKFSKETFADGLRAAALRNRRHPLREWLDATEPTWDGVSRIDSWLTTYLGVEDNEYTRAVGAIFLTAAVRRARKPGCKFDELLVLEGPQGIGKSSAVAALCPTPEWFSEDFNVSMDSKQLLEITLGKWIVEAPELSKLKSAEFEQVKHLLSRRVDSARLAYARSRTDRGRQWVGFATVNGDRYLGDPTGNRRFWPVRCGTVRDDLIERDRGQLWAEAAVRETSGASIRLPEALWALAAVEQAERVVVDELMEELAPALDSFESGLIATADLWQFLMIPLDRRSSAGHKIGPVMKRLGWERRQIRLEGVRTYVYIKGQEAPRIFYDPTARKFMTGRPGLHVVAN